MDHTESGGRLFLICEPTVMIPTLEWEEKSNLKVAA